MSSTGFFSSLANCNSSLLCSWNQKRHLDCKLGNSENWLLFLLQLHGKGKWDLFQVKVNVLPFFSLCGVSSPSFCLLSTCLSVSKQTDNILPDSHRNWIKCARQDKLKKRKYGIVAYSLLLLLFNGFDQHEMMSFSFSFLKINIFNIFWICVDLI